MHTKGEIHILTREKSRNDAILKVKELAEAGYTHAVLLDPSKYFDTLNHQILLNQLRKSIKDERVIQIRTVCTVL